MALPGSDYQTSTPTTIIGSVSSDGKIRVFDLNAIPTKSNREEKLEIACIAEYDTNGSRLICCVLADGESRTTSQTSNKKRKTADAEEDGDEDDQGNSHTPVVDPGTGTVRGRPGRAANGRGGVPMYGATLSESPSKS